jgi:hypothetical protein
MPKLPRSVSVGDLLAAGTPVYPHEAVTLVLQVCRYLAWKASIGEPVDVPAVGDIRIDAAGEAVVTDLRSAAAPPAVADVALLLDRLLPEAGSDPERRVSGVLRYTVARALGQLDVPAFSNLTQFCAALERFERDPSRDSIGVLFDRWRASTSTTAPVPAVLADGGWVVDQHGFRSRRGADEVLTQGIVAHALIERRKTAPRADTFRLLLREADRQLFEYASRSVPDPAPSASSESSDGDPRERRGSASDEATGGGSLAEADRQVYERKHDAAGEVTLVDPADLFSSDVASVASRRRAPRLSRTQALSLAATLMVTIGLSLAWLAANRASPSQMDVRSRAGATTEHGAAAAPAGRLPSRTVRRTTIPGPRAESTDAGVSTRRHGADPDRATQSAPPRGALAGAGPDERFDRRPDVVAPDDSAGESTQLVRASHVGGRPVFAPPFDSNGSAVFFHGVDEGVDSPMQTDGSPDGSVLHVTSIVDDDGAKNYHVQISPDGRSIAFDSDRDGERGVYVAHRDGTSVRRVSGPGFAAVPTWAPDGGRLAFVRAEADKPTVWNLWVLEVADGTRQRLTNYPDGQLWGASWFPDGRRVCYSHDDSLYVLDLATKNATKYAAPTRGRLARTPAVSPDGRRVVFQVFPSGAWLLDLKDGSMRRILTDPTAEEFTWAPDGRRVAFHSRRQGGWGLWVPGL